MSTAQIAVVDATKYRYRVSPGWGMTRLGKDSRCFFRSWKAWSHSGVHSNFDAFLSTWKKSSCLSAERAKKRPSAASCSIKVWASFNVLGGYIMVKALTLAGLACNPLLEIICPRNLPVPTPNMHLAGFSLSVVLLRVCKVSIRSFV